MMYASNRTKQVCLLLCCYFLAFSFHSFTSFAQNKSDSLKKIISKTPLSDTAFSSVVRELSELYKSEGNIDKGIEFINKVIQENPVKQETSATAQNNIAALKITLGQYYQLKGKYPEAQTNFISALKTFEKTKYKDGEISGIYSMANLYRLEKQPAKSLELNFKLIKMCDSSHIYLSTIFNNIALIYDFDYEKSDSALFYYFKALDISKKQNNLRGQATVYGNISGVYTIQNKFKEAMIYRMYALNIDIKNNDVEGQIYDYWGIGQIFEYKKQSDSAEYYYHKALQIAKDLKLNREVYEAHMVLADFYAGTRQFEKAYIEKDSAHSMSQQIFNEDMANSLNKMQTQFETEKKEQEIKLLEQDQLQKQSDIERQKQIIIWGIVVLAVIMILLILFIKSNYERKRINLILSQQKIELEKLSIVASETTNAVAITDAYGEVLWLNRGFEKLYNTDLKTILSSGKTNAKVLSSNPEIEQLLINASKSLQTAQYVSKITDLHGNEQWIQTTLTPIAKDGVVHRLVFIDADITLLKEAENEILSQRNLLEHINKQTTRSIKYAQNLQKAILPAEKSLKNSFNDYFILFQPKDIVSGDFYWMKETDDCVLFSVIDCTGHGVPGAFMTIFAHNLLEVITGMNKVTRPADILKELSIHLEERLSKGDEKVNDGMDMILCSYHKKTGLLQLAGAFNSAFIVSSNELTEFKGDLFPIGEPKPDEHYTNYECHLKKDDMLYLFTDGYTDQKGGDKNKKFMVKNFKELLISISNEDMNQQKNTLEEKINTWIGKHEQMDDICVMGIRF